MQGGGHGKRFAILVAATAVSVFLKAFYSAASVNDLKWLLAPATWMVSVVCGESFAFEDYSGYLSSDGSFVIAAPCAGMNFLIAAFMMLVIIVACRCEIPRWSAIPGSLGIAYLATIGANTVRIVTALELHRMDPPMIWVNPEQLHRMEGILIYFGFLLALFFLAESLTCRGRRAGIRWAAWSLLPLGIYWIVTLGVPMLNGAREKHSRFLEHSLFVLITPTVLMLPLLIVWLLKRRRPAVQYSPYR
jgi:exosortase K